MQSTASLMFLSATVLAVVTLTAKQPQSPRSSWGGGGTAAIVPPSGGDVLTPDQVLRRTGKSLGEWGEDWWNWVYQFPLETNPLIDTTGELADQGQSGRVWFLAGNIGGTAVRECTVPPGKLIFFPIINFNAFAPEDAPDLEGVRFIANVSIDAVDILEVEIDGVPVTDLYAYRGQSPPGGYVQLMPADGLAPGFGLVPGDRDPSVTDGYWIMLAPLHPGEHVVHFRGGITAVFEVDLTYFLTVSGH